MVFPLFAHRCVRQRYSLWLKYAASSLVCATLAFALPAYSADMSLTLEQAQQDAVKRSRQLASQGHAVDASRDMAVAAGQLPDPVLKLGVDNLPVSGPDRGSLTNDFMTMRRVGVMQEITRADKRQARANRFERAADKSLAEKTMTTASIERDTALAWLDRYYAEKMAAVVVEQGQQAKLEIQAAEGAYRGGRGNRADIITARNAWVMFEDRHSEAQRRVNSATTMLVRWVGDAGAAPLAGKPALDRVRLDPAALESQLAQHPQIAVLTSQQAIAEADAQLAHANKKADWSVEVAYQQRGPAYSNMVSIGVSVPLQWAPGNRQDREVSAKLAMVEQAKAEKEDALRAHVAETRVMIEEWQNNRERLARFERELLPLANERTFAVIAAYRGGKTSLADVLAARRNEIDVRTQALQLEAETARLWAQINFLFPTNAPAHPAAMTTKDSK
jgi:outer membrane protein TolC